MVVEKIEGRADSTADEQLFLKYAHDMARLHFLERFRLISLAELTLIVLHPHPHPSRRQSHCWYLRPKMDGQQRRMSIGSYKKLGDDICRYGLCIRQCERKVESLNMKQSNIELEMSNLGDMVVAKIEGKADSAAAVIHKLLRASQSEQLYLKYAHDILGVVALLGEVRTHKLSSMLSTCLGEDQMLAVVCKSHAAARALENYQMDGTVNCVSALDILAAKFGTSIKGRCSIICLEDIRPYMRGVGRHPQIELAFPPPSLSNGKTPPGFLGFAVNMIFPPAEHLQIRTASGHDLRETSFYRLLGKLQVYQSREYLYMAHSCIEDGAVSLDGGMIRGNGVVSIGWNDTFYFQSTVWKDSCPSHLRTWKD